MKREIRVTPAALMGEKHTLKATLNSKRITADDGSRVCPKLFNELTQGIKIPCDNPKDSCAIRGGNVIWYATGSDAGGGPPNLRKMEEKIAVAERLAARTLTTYARLKTLLAIYDREKAGDFSDIEGGD